MSEGSGSQIYSQLSKTSVLADFMFFPVLIFYMYRGGKGSKMVKLNDINCFKQNYFGKKMVNW